jgi:hypothetical protein
MDSSGEDEAIRFLGQRFERSWLKQLFPAKATYDLSYHCPDCKIYIVDYSKSYSRKEANELAESI